MFINRTFLGLISVPSTQRFHDSMQADNKTSAQTLFLFSFLCRVLLFLSLEPSLLGLTHDKRTCLLVLFLFQFLATQ